MSRVLLAGGSGLVGQAICKRLLDEKHEVVILSRNPKPNSTYSTFKWDPMNGTVDENCMDGVNYVINLAGAGIADKRWSAARKRLIIESRVKSAQVLNQLFSKTKKPIKYIAASAIGYYGNSGSAKMNESSLPGKGFLTEVVVAWEKAIQEIANAGTPVQIVRVGIVMSTKGGALEKMLATYPFKLGNYFGSGDQIYSWIHIEDLANIFLHLLTPGSTPQILNGTAPNPVSNKTMAHAINKAGNYKAIIAPAPKFAIKLMLGEMSAVVLDSTNVSNEQLISTGFKFQWPEVHEALEDILANKK